MRPAARIGDACVPHCSPFVIMTGNPTVLIEGRPASCVGDAVVPHLIPAKKCFVHAPVIGTGSATVFVGGKPLSRIGDKIVACTAIASGAPTVLVGG